MSSYVTRKTPGDTTWFTHDRFGMFIHWGLYAMPARHEWVKTRERMTDDHYDRYFRHFDPDLYDPRQWARMAKAAGMKYAVIQGLLAEFLVEIIKNRTNGRNGHCSR